MEADQALAVGLLRLDGGGELALPENHLSAGAQLLAGADQTLPKALPLVGEQQHLTHAAGGPVADEAGGQHPGVVQHQTVPRAEELGQLIEVMVLGGPSVLVQGQQPGGVSTLQGGLGDELLGQVKVKIRSFQTYVAFLL